MSEPETIYLNYNYVFILCWWAIGIFYAKRNLEYEEKLNLMIEQKEIKFEKSFIEYVKALFVPIAILSFWTFFIYDLPLFLNALISWTPLWFFYVNQLRKDYYDSKHRLLDYRMNLTLALISLGNQQRESDITMLVDKKNAALIIQDNAA